MGGSLAGLTNMGSKLFPGGAASGGAPSPSPTVPSGVRGGGESYGSMLAGRSPLGVLSETSPVLTASKLGAMGVLGAGSLLGGSAVSGGTHSPIHGRSPVVGQPLAGARTGKHRRVSIIDDDEGSGGDSGNSDDDATMGLEEGDRPLLAEAMATGGLGPHLGKGSGPTGPRHPLDAGNSRHVHNDEERRARVQRYLEKRQRRLNAKKKKVKYEGRPAPAPNSAAAAAGAAGATAASPVAPPPISAARAALAAVALTATPIPVGTTPSAHAQSPAPHAAPGTGRLVLTLGAHSPGHLPHLGQPEGGSFPAKAARPPAAVPPTLGSQPPQPPSLGSQPRTHSTMTDGGGTSDDESFLMLDSGVPLMAVDGHDLLVEDVGSMLWPSLHSLHGRGPSPAHPAGRHGRGGVL